MIQNLGPFPGEWCDIDWSPADGEFVFAAHEQPGRIVLRAGLHAMLVRGSYDLGRSGLYLRAAADGQGNVCCVLQDGRDRNPATGDYFPAIVVLFPRDSPPREIACPAGPAFGQNAVEVVRYAGMFRIYVATSPTTYWWGDLRVDGSGPWWQNQWREGMPASSQGFADGVLQMDIMRASVHGMVCPSTADGLSIGQAGEPDRIRGLHNGVYFTAIPGAAFEPHLASDGQGRWLACARTPQGAALVALQAPFEAEQGQPEPPPPTPDPPAPQPDPTPEEPTVSIPDHFQIAQDVSAEHPHLIAANNKDTMTELLWRIAWALFHRDQNWGLLSKSAGENHTVIAGQRVAVDALAYGDSDEIVDIFRAAHDGPGTGGLTWSIDERRPSNVRVVPPPYPGTPAPPPVTDPPPTQPPPTVPPTAPPTDDTREILALLKASFAEQQRQTSLLLRVATALETALQEMDNQPVPSLPSGDTAAAVDRLREMLEDLLDLGKLTAALKR